MNGDVSKTEDDSSSKMDESGSNTASDSDNAKVLAGEVIRTWKSTSRHGKQGKCLSQILFLWLILYLDLVMKFLFTLCYALLLHRCCQPR